MKTLLLYRILQQEHFSLKQKKTGTDTVVQSSTVVIEVHLDYDWTVGNIPDINVINLYGEALKVYQDRVYVFTLEHTKNLWIISVSFGEYLLEAKKDDDQVVDTITMVVAEYKDYEWTIDGQ